MEQNSTAEMETKGASSKMEQNSTAETETKGTSIISSNSHLQRIYNLKGTPESCAEAYRDWAKTYDDDVLMDMGYVAPWMAAEALAKLIQESKRKDVVLLDAGCGTGLVGDVLSKELGFINIDGSDISPEMLRQAELKNCYRKLTIEDLTKTLGHADDLYDAVICVGTFTHRHVGPEGFDELVRVTKPNGHIVATIHEEIYVSLGFEKHLQDFEKEGKAKICSIIDAPYHLNSCKLVTIQASRPLASTDSDTKLAR